MTLKDALHLIVLSIVRLSAICILSAEMILLPVVWKVTAPIVYKLISFHYTHNWFDVVVCKGNVNFYVRNPQVSYQKRLFVKWTWTKLQK